MNPTEYGTIAGPDHDGYPTCCVCHTRTDDPVLIRTPHPPLELLIHEACFETIMRNARNRISIEVTPA